MSMSKVDIRATWLDGTQNHYTAYDVIDEDTTSEAADDGYAVFSPTPDGDGTSMFIINLRATRALSVVLVPDPEEPGDAAPVDAV
jgi:hypothetical protein